MKMRTKFIENKDSYAESNAGCKAEGICTQKGESHTRRQVFEPMAPRFSLF